MAVYPGSESERRIEHDALHRAVTQIFEACGMAHTDASLLALTLTDADLRGVHSHGVMRVGDYVGRLGSAQDASSARPSVAGIRGGVNPRARPRIARDAGAALVVDGDNAMGQIACTFAMDAAIERAASTGIAFAAVGNSNHCGGLYWYVQRAIDADMLGIASTNALPTMAPWGGSERIVGMNPLAIGIPAARKPPFLLDAAFAECARGKVVVYQQKQQPIPEHWAFDANGVPTTDPGAALEGLLRPIGGYKGVNIAIALGVLSTLLSGAGYGVRMGNLDDGPIAGRDGQFMLALNIAALVELTDFKREMDDVITEIQSSRRATGVERIFSAGELEYETACDYRQHGIPLNDATLDELAQTARRVGVGVSDWLLR